MLRSYRRRNTPESRALRYPDGQREETRPRHEYGAAALPADARLQDHEVRPSVSMSLQLIRAVQIAHGWQG